MEQLWNAMEQEAGADDEILVTRSSVDGFYSSIENNNKQQTITDDVDRWMRSNKKDPYFNSNQVKRG